MKKQPPQLTYEQKIDYLFNKKWEEEHQEPDPWWECLLLPLFIGLMFLFIFGVTALANWIFY